MDNIKHGKIGANRSLFAGIILGLMLFVATSASAYVRYSATQTIAEGDITTTHIADSTILPADLNQSSMGVWANIGFSPVGSIIAYSSTTAPTGWFLANGSAVSRTTYSALFSVIGTSYGVGDGSTTFNLPNIAGRNILMASTTANIGQTGGESNHTLTVAELASHTHNFLLAEDSVTASARARGTSAATGGSQTTASTGGDTPHNVLDPYIVLNYIIKY